MLRIHVLWRRGGDPAQRQADIDSMFDSLRTTPTPAAGFGRLHIEGKTVGENPFPNRIQSVLMAEGFVLDKTNWIYHKTAPTESAAEAEVARLLAEHAALFRETGDRVEARIMQDHEELDDKATF